MVVFPQRRILRIVTSITAGARSTCLTRRRRKTRSLTQGSDMKQRSFATLLLSACLGWGCGSAEIGAAQAEPNTQTGVDVTSVEDGTTANVANTSAPAAPSATTVSRGGASTTTVAPATPVSSSSPAAATVQTPATSSQNTQTASQPAPTTTLAAAPTNTAPRPTAAPTVTNPLLTRTVKVLALGDSMTAGHEDDLTRFRSYRGRLFEMLVAGGYSVDFVGTQKLTPAIGGDPDHDGYGGAWIGPGGSSHNLSDKLPGILGAVDPDIIILALGWNSVYHEPSVAGSKYRDLVNRIVAAKPNAHVIVATLSPQRGQTEAQSAADLSGYRALNEAARSLASASTSDRIHLADYAAGGFQWSEYWDVIHWLQPGADRAAQILYRTLINGPLKR
jgi:lysophospholipase L1-like esterase